MFPLARESACVGGFTPNSGAELITTLPTRLARPVEEFWRAGAIDEAPGNTRLRKRVTLGASSDTGLADSGADHNDA
jgi:hypothetical protein